MSLSSGAFSTVAVIKLPYTEALLFFQSSQPFQPIMLSPSIDLITAPSTEMGSFRTVFCSAAQPVTTLPVSAIAKTSNTHANFFNIIPLLLYKSKLYLPQADIVYLRAYFIHCNKEYKVNYRVEKPRCRTVAPVKIYKTLSVNIG